MSDTRQCDCKQPWPDMIRLSVWGSNRYYLCLACGTIRRELTIDGTPGTTGAVTFHELTDLDLPQAVRETAWDLLRPGQARQAALL